MVFTTPFFYEEVHIGQLGLDTVGVCAGLIYLVDGENDGNACCLCVVDSLNGLWHNLVVGSNDDDGDIGHLGTTCTHSGKCFVARSVEESNLAAIGGGNFVGTNVLGDTAGLACNDVGLADVVKQRGLTVIHVTHNGNDGVTCDEVLRLVGFFNFLKGVDNFGACKTDVESEFVGDEAYRFGVEALVDTHEDAHLHTGCDNLCDGDVHHRGQLICCHELCNLQSLLALHLSHLLLFDVLVHFLAFLAVVLRCFRFTHRAQTSEGLLNLLLYFGVVNLWFLLFGGFFLLLALLILAFGVLLCCLSL